MTSTTTKACDKCGMGAMDPDWKYTTIGGKTFDLCISCAVLLETEIKAPRSAEEQEREVRLAMLRESHKTLAADTVRLVRECEALKNAAKDHERVMKARNDAWLAEHARVLKLEEQLSDALDHAEFLEKDIEEIVGMLGKKRRKKNAARLKAMGDAYMVVLDGASARVPYSKSIEVIHTREPGKPDKSNVS